MPPDRTGDDRRLAVWAVVVRRLLRAPARWGCSWPGFPVVIGSPGRVAEHPIGGEDVLQPRVGHRALCFVCGGSGVGVVVTKLRAVGVADLGLGRG